jgi:hypothetical protein
VLSGLQRGRRLGLSGSLFVRSLILFVVLLAGAKFGYQEYVYRSALTEALINTYRQDAVERCQQEAKTRNLALSYTAWSQPESLSLVVGRSTREAASTDLGAVTLSTSTYLVLVARKAPAEIRCEFDIVKLSASVFQL